MPTLECRVAVASPNHALDGLIQNGFAHSLIESPYLKSTDYKVNTDILIVDEKQLPELAKVRHQINFHYCYLVFENQTSKVNTELYNQFKPDQILSKTELTEALVFSQLENLDLKRQNEAKKRLTFELIDQDQQIKASLRQQIFQDQQELIDRRQKILEVNNRIESLRKILFSLSEENDVTRIETLLNELLPQSTAATWVKIIPDYLSEKFENDLQAQLPNFFVKKQCSKYFIYFMKGNNRPFRSSDNEMFLKVSDALHFNLLKVESLSKQQHLEKIVSTAINSTAYPLLVVDRDYNILESNTAFHRYPAKTENAKCYQVMFNREAPCVDCKFGTTFQAQTHSETTTTFHNVQSQKLSGHEERNSHWVHFYVDVTEEKMLEQRLSQTAKMKELGLISSSIAHELNNPLGGIISYIQILQMELNKEHQLQGELKDMNMAAQRMKHIIENLLIFSRRPATYEKETVQIKDLLLESLKMNELSFKIENIKVVQHIDQTADALIVSRSNFRDSLNLIFNFFIEGLRRVRTQKNTQTGLIEVKFSQDQINFYLDLQSNIGPLNDEQKNKNIYFLVIHKSLIDQGFQVELTEPNASWVAMRVTLPKASH
jgi:hypothetical protein